MQRLHSNVEQRSEKWFEQRKGRITASAVGAIMGLAPYQTRNDVMRRMIREYHNASSEFSGNAATEYGTFHESGAIAEFEMETGLSVKSAPFVVSEKYDFMGASPDGYVSDGRLIEIKCPYGLRNGGDFKSIEEQKHYYYQIQMQLFCTNKKECYFFQWSPLATKLEIVKRNEKEIKKMIKECLEFYDVYLNTISQKTEDLEHFLGDKYKKHDSKELDDMMLDYISISEKIKKLEEDKKAIMSGLISLTDNKGGEIAGHKLYKVSKQGSISYAKALKELLPEANLEPYRGNPSEHWAIK